jgi:hypothetical protein
MIDDINSIERIEDGNDDIWVFVSHSSKDFEKVRKLRNMMEDIGLRPLLFYLKCLKKDPEIFELLKREIDVRPRFILCDSENSRESKYVNEEVRYIKSKRRQYVTVDIEDEASFMRKIQELKRRSQIFLSYSRNDHELARRIAKALQEVGFNVIEFTTLSSGDFAVSIRKTIRDVSSKGYFIPLVTDSYLKSRWCQEELNCAINCSVVNPGFILPLVTNCIEDITDSLRRLTHLNHFTLPDETPESIADFVERLQEYDSRYNV